jgi:RHS repeat-associated protein
MIPFAKLCRWLRYPKATSARRTGRGRLRARTGRWLPFLEALEDRLLPSTVTWVGGSGDWSNPSNWSDGTINRLPGPQDDAIINVQGISVTHGSGSDTVQSLTVNDPLSLTGGTLAVSGNLAVQNGNTLTLAGGTLTSATVLSGSTLSAVTNTFQTASTLSGVTLDGTLNLSFTAFAALVNVSGNLTLNGGTISMGGACQMTFVGSQTLGGTGSVLFDTSSAGNTGLSVAGGTTLTIGAGISIHGTNGFVGNNLGTANTSIVNHGSISADTTGGTIAVEASTWSSDGTLSASGSGTLSLYGAWTNTGTISALAQSTVNLGGTFSTTDLGTINGVAGTINITGSLNNTGTLALDAGTGSWQLAGGTITGGTITTAGGAALRAVTTTFNVYSTLAGVRLAGTFNLVPAGFGALVHVTSGLTLNGGGVNISGGGQLIFTGTQILGGNGIVTFADNTPNAVRSDSPLTIAAGITIHGSNGRVDAGNSTFINQGTISADVPGQTITLSGVNWTNTGIIQAVGGGFLSLGGTWSYGGTIISNTAGFIYVTGTLDNRGQTLTLSDTTGSWGLESGGTILGGTIATSGSAELLGGHYAGTLDGVTLTGTLDLKYLDGGIYVGALANVIDGLTLDHGTVNVGSGQLAFVATQAFAGIGTVTIAGGSLRISQNSCTVTVGTGISVQAVGGGGVSAPPSSSFNFLGTVRSSGGTLTIQGCSNYANGTLTGGSWEAVNGFVNFVGAQIVTDATTITLDGSLYGSSSSMGLLALADVAATGRLILRNGAEVDTSASAFTNEGSVLIGSGSDLTVAGTYSSSGGTTVDGTLVASPTVTLAGGGTLNGAGRISASVVNGGIVTPGDAPGTLTISGAYTQTSSGALDVEIGGITAGSQYDQLRVAGLATLAGTLNVSFINGFGTTAGQTFTIMTFGSSSGAFSAMNGLGSLSAMPGATAFVLTAGDSAPDLAFNHMTLPSGATPGQMVSIPYTVDDLTSTTVTGDWYDSVYLSTDGILDPGDTLLTRIHHVGGVAGNGSYSETASAPLPPLTDGNYKVIVLVDDRRLVPDANRANNTGVSAGALTVSTPTLSLGTTASGTIASGQDVYYHLNLGAGKDVTVTATLSAPVEAEFYVRYAQLPDQSNFDQAYPNLNDLSQRNLLANPQGGSYFVLLHGREGAGTGQPFTLRADTVPFAVTSFTPTTASNAGQATITITGADLTGQTEVNLLGSANNTIAASNVTFKDDHTLYATFDVRGLSPAAYSVQLSDHGQTVTSAATFTVTPGNPGKLVTHLTVPAAIRPQQANTYVTIDYANVGGSDIPAPLLQLEAVNADLRLPEQADYAGSTLQVLGINQGGPAGVLPPGYRGSMQVFFTPLISAPLDTCKFNLYVPGDPSTSITWADFKDNLQPATIANDAWDAIWQNFTSAVGTTLGQYLNVLAQDATTLSRSGVYTADVGRLLAFEIAKADDGAPSPTLGSMVIDAQFPSPGLLLGFDRSFLQPLDGRYRLGLFGRGWVSSWEISASTDASRNVTVQQGGQSVTYILQADGTYAGPSSVNTTLSRVGPVYQLRASDGSVTVFRADGTLDYVQDRDGNRITAGYKGSELTSLTHSDGDALVLSYNAQGRISQITDPAGRVTSYTYDASGEHLISVLKPDGNSLDYTYTTNTAGPLAHALLSMTNLPSCGCQDETTSTFFAYDSQGRLASRSQAGGAERITYAFDAFGNVSVTDALGNTRRFLLNEVGQVAGEVDALGNVSEYVYDGANNLTASMAPGYGAVASTYDARGNLVGQVNPLGQSEAFAYDASNDMTSMRDALGNTTGFQYDANGNLVSTIDAGGNSDRLSYDAQGNVIRQIDNNGNAVNYTYNARGQLTRKDYADGSHADFTYDSHGNLTVAALVTSSGTLTTTYAYDSADRLVQVSDPNNHVLRYAYDDAGRRVQSNQDGFIVNYTYDSVDRLSTVTDQQGNVLAVYTYDAAGQGVETDLGNGTYSKRAYDRDGRLVSLVNYGPRPGVGQNGPIISRFDYTYDGLGRVASMTTLDGTTTYTYDADGQLTSANLPSGRTITYQYDAAGNRVAVTDQGVTTTYAANDLNQLAAAGATTFHYDANGNLISRTDATGTTAYTYDAENHLIGVGGPADTWTFQYDALGTRISASHNGQQVDYVTDPTGLGSVVGEYTGSGALIANYGIGLGLLNRVGAGGTTAFYGFDGNGNTSELTGAGGTVLNSYSYLPFGESLIATGATPNPFTYVGQFGVMSGAAGLYFMRARWYSPDLGRFTQPDPTGLAGEDANLYRYVQNDPVGAKDPSGLDGLGPPDTSALVTCRFLYGTPLDQGDRVTCLLPCRWTNLSKHAGNCVATCDKDHCFDAKPQPAPKPKPKPKPKPPTPPPGPNPPPNPKPPKPPPGPGGGGGGGGGGSQSSLR